MDLKDALTISLLGIGVVFVGLILTSLLIYSFSISEKISNLKLKKTFKTEETPYINIEKLEPDILAVITTVLEIENRLGLALMESRFTFKNGTKI